MLRVYQKNRYSTMVFFSLHTIRIRFFSVVAILFFLAPSFLSATSTSLLDVPFSSQAPTGEWVDPWNNACEETATVMINAYYSNLPLTPDVAPQAIEEMIGLKEEYKGKKTHDESMADLSSLVTHTFRTWRGTVANHITTTSIEREIDNGRPVIIPFDARKLKNAGYGTPAPPYHTAVIVGYDREKQEFILNDPGLSAGQNVHVPYVDLLNANATYTIHDTKEVRGGDALFTFPHRSVSDRIRDMMLSITESVKHFFRLIFMRKNV